MNLEIVGMFLASWFVVACLIFLVNEMLHSSATFGGYNKYGKVLIAPVLAVAFVISLPRKMLQKEADT